MNTLTDTDATRVALSEKRGTGRGAYPYGFLLLACQPRPPLWRRVLRKLLG